MNKQKLIAAILAGVCIVCLLILAVKGFSRKTLRPDVVFFGDSRVGNDRTDTALPVLLEKATGLDVYNAGIGATGMAVLSDGSAWDRYSMVYLSEAMVNNDFSAIHAASPDNYYKYNEIVGYVGDTVKDIESIDFQNVKYIIVEQVTNDYLSGVPLYDENDPFNVNTFAGAFRTTVNNLKKAAPNAEIIVISPCFTFTISGYGDELDLGYGTEEDYAEYERELALETGVSFVDYYHDSSINRDNWKDYLFDGLHMNDEGNRVLIELILEKLKQD